MVIPRRRLLHLTVSVAALPFVSRIARAQAYPTRPITMVVPFAPGGLADVIGRIVAEGMRPSLGQTVIIENVGGAGGNIGTGRVARAAPDGYTLVLGIWNTHVANGAIYSLRYDIVRDFEPVALLADAPLLLVVNNTVPANDLSEFVAWLRANPDKTSMGTVGAGSPEKIPCANWAGKRQFYRPIIRVQRPQQNGANASAEMLGIGCDGEHGLG
jgi:tripartite-type tricarboxylate transporter receptor subunit TctC